MGISVDDSAETAEWARKIGVTFPLLSDRGAKVSKRFDLFDAKSGTSAKAVAVIDEGKLLFTKRVISTEVPTEISPWKEALARRS